MFNQATVIGNLGRDPETRYTGNGDAVCNISVATSESWKNKEGEKVEKTEWHRIVVFGKLAEICGQYLKKGKTVMFQGRLQTKSYEKDGVKHYTTEIVADTMKMLGGGDRSEGGGETTSSRPANSGGRVSKPAAAKPAQKSLDDDLDDDIPF